MPAQLRFEAVKQDDGLWCVVDRSSGAVSVRDESCSVACRVASAANGYPYTATGECEEIGRRLDMTTTEENNPRTEDGRMPDED